MVRVFEGALGRCKQASARFARPGRDTCGSDGKMTAFWSSSSRVQVSNLDAVTARRAELANFFANHLGNNLPIHIDKETLHKRLDRSQQGASCTLHPSGKK